MDKEVLDRYLDVQERSLRDERYMEIHQRYRVSSGRLLSLLDAIPAEQRDTILAFIGDYGDLHQRLLEIACEVYG